MRLIKTFLVIVVLTSLAPAQQSGASTSPMNVDSVIRLSKAGFKDDMLIATIRARNQPLNLSVDDLIKLKNAGVSDAVIKVMLNPGGTASPASAGSAPAPLREGPATMPTARPSEDATPPVNTEPKANGRFRKLLDSTKSAVKQGVSSVAPNTGQPAAGERQNGGPFVVDQVGLRNILPQYDPQKPLSKQFPHVAVTVLKSPAMWGDYHGGFNGCWSLQVVVWSDERTSKTVGPFDWCAPRDEQQVPGPQYLRYTSPMPRLIDYDYSTGINRTVGPRPPSSVFPNDRETLELFARNNSRHGTMELALDGSSRFALMFMNLRLAMGQSLADDDRRVWIVSIK